LNAKYLTRYACALRTTLGSRQIIARGRDAGHCRRLRRVTPPRLVYALLEALGGLRVRTIADLLRTFNAQNDLAVRYKAFYNRLAHRAFPQFMRQVYSEVLCKLSINMLRAAAGSRLEFFRDVVVQDGSSFAVHDGLATVYGGRFTKIRPPSSCTPLSASFRIGSCGPNWLPTRSRSAPSFPHRRASWANCCSSTVGIRISPTGRS